MSVEVPAPRVVAARSAVATLFLLNAVAYANVVPRLPAIKAELGLSNTALGTAVAAMPVGALLSGSVAGRVVERLGSGRLAAACGVGFGLVLPGFAVASSWFGLAATFLLLGASDALMDVAMNAHALRVQRGYGRSIINGLHGMWSVGAVVGGLAGTAAAAAGVGLGTHLVVAGAAIVASAMAVRRWLLPGDDEAARQAAGSDGLDPAPGTHQRSRGVGRRLLLLGIIVVMSAVIEDAPQSWGAVLLRTELGASAGVAGLVYLAFQGSMTLSRFLGDRVVDRYGDVAVVRAGGLLSAAGTGAGLLIGEPASVIVGFGLAGLGTAALFPLVFHGAGNLPGLATGHGVAAVAWMGRVGFLVAPPLVGVVSDAVSVRAGLAVVPAAGVVIALFAGALRSDGPATSRRSAGTG